MKPFRLRFATPLLAVMVFSAIPAEAASYQRTTTVVVKPSHRYPPRSVYYSRGTVRDVQRELAKRRFYRGRIDGDFGPRTSSAIRSYQVSRRLPVTGQIDRVLLRSLHIRY
ncbi:MAG TPA: peptidoglycan-binding domain-containing protein [Chthoniobacteraceae bacterium]|nr:peptidoglycan-binding domain-containing protein [Chthoniobacteraceae bacterium]